MLRTLNVAMLPPNKPKAKMYTKNRIFGNRHLKHYQISARLIYITLFMLNSEKCIARYKEKKKKIQPLFLTKQENLQSQHK